MEQTFKAIVARYCETKPEDMDPEKRFREDLGFSSLDFMSLLGELEDTFDIELEDRTIGESLELLEKECLE